MMQSKIHTDETYVAQVANAALAAIINLYSDETGHGRVVEPEGEIEGLCVAIAMLAYNTGLSDTPDDRRILEDECRKRLIFHKMSSRKRQSAASGRLRLTVVG